MEYKKVEWNRRGTRVQWRQQEKINCKKGKVTIKGSCENQIRQNYTNTEEQQNKNNSDSYKYKKRKKRRTRKMQLMKSKYSRNREGNM